MAKPLANGLLPQSDTTLYLVDISSFIFRAFFAVRALKNKKGEPTNAIYGVATMLGRLLEEALPHFMAVIYDSKSPSFRKEIYSDYKAHRTEPPDDLIPQFDQVDRLVQVLEIHSYRQDGIEADDLIATITRQWCARSPDHTVVIVSSDKDLMQLVEEKKVWLWDTMNQKVYGPKEVEEKLGVPPHQVRDYLALLGDASDNIPGVPGIGPKSACDLLKIYANLDDVLKAAKAGEIAGKKRETLVLHESDARLSAQLATLKEDLSIDLPMDQLRYRFHLTESAIEFLKEQDFHTLLSRWQQDLQKQEQPSLLVDSGISPTVLNDQPERFKLVYTQEAFYALMTEMERVKNFGFDLETTSLNPREAQLVGIAICCDAEKGAYYIPVGHQQSSVTQLPCGWVLEQLKPFLESKQYGKIGQNLKYDWNILRAYGLHPQGIIADTMVAAYLLDPEGRKNLKALASRYLDYTVLSYEEVCGKGKDEIGFDQVDVNLAARYSAEDAWIAVRLWEQLKPKLEEEKLLIVFNEIELPLIGILSSMEHSGVCIDTEWLKQLSGEFKKELKSLEDRVYAYSSASSSSISSISKDTLNLNSPKQLAVFLFEDLKLPVQSKTKTGWSTDAQVLEALAPLHEVPRLLLEYREISKLNGTYVEPLSQVTAEKKIHAQFHQTVTATGRLSSSDPNLQNIPIRSNRGMKIRRAFVPSAGCVLLSADYSQIELRLLAHLSQDPALLYAFQENHDVHQQTASDLFQIALDQVSDEQRAAAKAINFGLMYGKTAFGLSQELKIPRKQAQEMIDQYFIKYHGVKRYLEEQVQLAREQGWVRTLSGRKRWLPDIESKNMAIRNNSERMAKNTPIQGTAADLMKLAMIRIEEALRTQKLQAKMTIQVHDEIVLDVPQGELEAVTELTKNAMESAMSLSVPLQVNVMTGKNWMDCS